MYLSVHDCNIAELQHWYWTVTQKEQILLEHSYLDSLDVVDVA